MAGRAPESSWADAIVAMDRSLRVFTDFIKPILVMHEADQMSLSNLVFLISIGPGEARVNDIVKRGRYVGSNASYALKALTSQGLIERNQDPNDRRNALVNWTERGEQLVRDIKIACKGHGRAHRDACDLLTIFENHCARRPSK